MSHAINSIWEFEPKYLVVSAGLDIYECDPIGTFKITLSGIRTIGSAIRTLDLPTLFVMEGGYDQDTLGKCMVALLEPFT